MRTFFLAMALTGFAALAVMDLHAGHYKTGIPGLLLVVVNGMLLY